MSEVKIQQQENCCQGDEVFCISIPGIDITILGNSLQLDPICLKIPFDGIFSPNQATQLQSVMNFFNDRNISSSDGLNNTNQITQIQEIMDVFGESSGELTKDQIIQIQEVMDNLSSSSEGLTEDQIAQIQGGMDTLGTGKLTKDQIIQLESLTKLFKK